MKKLLLLCLVFISGNGFAQRQLFKFNLSPDSTITYENTVSLDSSYKFQLLYKTTKTWFVNAFSNSKQVIQSEDINSGRIIGKGIITIPASVHLQRIIGANCNFTIQIDIKDGKYRYRIFNIYTDGYDLLNNYFKTDLMQAYNSYRLGAFKGNIVVKKETIYKNYEDAFIIIDTKINNLIKSIYADMVNSKKDDF